MKLRPAEIDRALGKGDGYALWLFYGPDGGLVADRARRLVTGIAGDAADPFRVVELEPDRVASEPQLLLEEAQSLSLTGGRRVVRIRRAGDRLTRAVTGLLAIEAPAAVTVLEAGELAAGSSLRKLVERSPRAAACPCYRLEERQLSRSIEGELRRLGLRASEEARAWLAEHLGADSGVTRAELEKLALYLGPGRKGEVGLEEVQAIVGDSSAIGLDGLVAAVLRGRPAETARLLDRLLAEGVHAVALLRAVSRACQQLLPLRHALDGGTAMEAVLAAARPPLHFRTRALFGAVLPRWEVPRLIAALRRLEEAELLCKTTGHPAELVCRHSLLEASRPGRAA